MTKFKYSRDLKEVVTVQETLTADEALLLLCNELLGEDYYFVEAVNGDQANVIMVRDILREYAPKKKKSWW